MNAEISADYERLVKRPLTMPRLIAKALSHAGFRAVAIYRLSHSLAMRGSRVRVKLLQSLMLHTCHCSISPHARIGPGFTIRHVGDIVIGARSVVGSNFDIRQGVTLGGNAGRSVNGRTQPTLGNNVTVGAGAKVLGPIAVGSNVTIGANAVVLRDIPDDAVAAGVPARLIRHRGERIHEEHSVAELEQVVRSLLYRLDMAEAAITALRSAC